MSLKHEAEFCIEAVEEVLARYAHPPEIFKTDQSSLLISTEFVKMLAAREIRIKMDGKGSRRYKVCVCRVWRIFK